jgi:hypothetical protein
LLLLIRIKTTTATLWLFLLSWTSCCCWTSSLDVSYFNFSKK